MNVSDAAILCEQHGSTLVNYQEIRLAVLMLRSGEQVLISIGTTSAKVFRRSSVFGWRFPKCCVSKTLVSWDSRYTQFDNFHRAVCRGMVLDGLLSLISRVESIDELCLAWCAFRNPLEVAASELFKRTTSNTAPQKERKEAQR
jgi:hypothetical protein